ncbi:TetR/AcrR family transcriptional regulator [Bradyrhizobium altum]|uniref:TetR/AcrR family transcriptional regulator n=1 Tax=Bradyrhizobium altum TaxID=1571202 RepID=UPI0024BF2E13|nr:TetR family transcriptional regulator [Bradyrhizobium altum]
MSIEKPRKSEIARNRILEAARRIFADDGYEHATIRAIAAEASINPSMVIRYYGSKEGLFAAVAKMDLKVASLAGVPVAQLGEALVGHALDRWDDPKDGAALAAMMRASISNEAARERIVAQFSEQVAGLFATMGPAAVQAAPFIATQMLGLAMARYIWRVPSIAALPKDLVVKQIGKAVQRYLDDAAEQQRKIL